MPKGKTHEEAALALQRAAGNMVVIFAPGNLHSTSAGKTKPRDRGSSALQLHLWFFNQKTCKGTPASRRSGGDQQWPQLPTHSTHQIKQRCEAPVYEVRIQSKLGPSCSPNWRRQQRRQTLSYQFLLLCSEHDGPDFVCILVPRILEICVQCGQCVQCMCEDRVLTPLSR